MLAVLDEAGCRGFKFEHGSSEWFVIAAVVFADEAAQTAAIGLEPFAKKLYNGHEVKFTTGSRQTRLAILEQVAALPISYHIVACDKKQVPSKQRKSEPLLYSAAEALLSALPVGLGAYSLWFDTLGGPSANKKYKSELIRRAGKVDGSSRIHRCSSKDSKDNFMLSIADYIASSAWQYLEKDSDEFRNRIHALEQSLIYWPKSQGEIEQEGQEQRGPGVTPARQSVRMPMRMRKAT